MSMAILAMYLGILKKNIFENTFFEIFSFENFPLYTGN